MQNAREKDEPAADGAAVDLLWGELEGRRDEDVVGAVEKHDMHNGGAEDQRDEEESGDLVLEEELLDAHVTASEPERNDDGTQAGNPPRHE